MAFYKARLKKMNGLYYPEAVIVGKQISTRQLAAALSDRCTVTLADTLAVLSELGTVMGSYLAQGRSVALDGLGSFRYTINAAKNGVETSDDVSAKQIKSVRVRFVPALTRNADRTVASRTLIPSVIDWIEWGDKETETTDAGDDDTTDTGNTGDNGSGSDTGSSGGSSGSGGDDSNPL